MLDTPCITDCFVAQSAHGCASRQVCKLMVWDTSLEKRIRSHIYLIRNQKTIMDQYHGTTILSVRRGNEVALGGDGQVTLGNIVIKSTARKIRRLYQDKVLAGFAGATADAFTLFERFEAKLEKHQGHLVRAAVDLTKDWRTDRVLRRLEAMLAIADKTSTLILTGNGDVLEPEQGIAAIGSGGAYAQAAASALLNHSELSARDIVAESLKIAGQICIYTNQNHIIETL